MYLIVGLGNPGTKYENTRHNIGFRVAEELATRFGVSVFKKGCKAFLGEGIVDGKSVVLAEPQTFMNNSGEAVKELLWFYKLTPDHLIVAYDDVDLEIGELRIRKQGGSAGHRGVESIIENIGSSDFIRVRIGIGRESLRADVTEYVLSEIPAKDRSILDSAVIAAADAIFTIVTSGLDTAMSKFNKLKPSV